MNTVTDNMTLQLDPLLSSSQVAEMVAGHFVVSPAHAKNRIMILPGFPRPVCATPSINGNGRPRWKRSTIIDWIQRQEQAA